MKYALKKIVTVAMFGIASTGGLMGFLACIFIAAKEIDRIDQEEAEEKKLENMKNK